MVEAGTANSAFAKGGRCPTVRQPLSTWAPALHRTDEPLVLCQSFLIALIGRQRALSIPIRENFSPPVSAGWLGPHAVSGERLLPADGSARATRNIAEALRVYESLRMRLREELGTVPSPGANADGADCCRYCGATAGGLVRV